MAGIVRSDGTCNEHQKRPGQSRKKLIVHCGSVARRPEVQRPEQGGGHNGLAGGSG